MKTVARICLLQITVVALMAGLSPGYGDSPSGTWHSRDVKGRTLVLRENGSFALVESGVPGEETSFNVEFTLAPGSAYLGYGIGPMPESIGSDRPVTTYKISVPLRDWEFTIRGRWTYADSTIQIGVSEFEISRVNEFSVTDYVTQRMMGILADVELSAAESDELSRLLAQITPMRGGLEELGAEVVVSFSVSGNELHTRGDDSQFTGDWLRDEVTTIVGRTSWGVLKRELW